MAGMGRLFGEEANDGLLLHFDANGAVFPGNRHFESALFVLGRSSPFCVPAAPVNDRADLVKEDMGVCFVPNPR